MGLATGLPTVGVAKNLHLIEDLGLEGERGEAARKLKESFKTVQAVGHQVPLVTQQDGRVLGAAVKTSLESKNPIFVSVGSGLSLKTAVSLVTSMSRYYHFSFYSLIMNSIKHIDCYIYILADIGYRNPSDRQIFSLENI